MIKWWMVVLRYISDCVRYGRSIVRGACTHILSRFYQQSTICNVLLHLNHENERRMKSMIHVTRVLVQSLALFKSLKHSYWVTIILNKRIFNNGEDIQHAIISSKHQLFTNETAKTIMSDDTRKDGIPEFHISSIKSLN